MFCLYIWWNVVSFEELCKSWTCERISLEHFRGVSHEGSGVTRVRPPLLAPFKNSSVPTKSLKRTLQTHDINLENLRNNMYNSWAVPNAEYVVGLKPLPFKTTPLGEALSVKAVDVDGTTQTFEGHLPNDWTSANSMLVSLNGYRHSG
jgi:hypothetical protein